MDSSIGRGTDSPTSNAAGANVASNPGPGSDGNSRSSHAKQTNNTSASNSTNAKADDDDEFYLHFKSAANAMSHMLKLGLQQRDLGREVGRKIGYAQACHEVLAFLATQASRSDSLSINALASFVRSKLDPISASSHSLNELSNLRLDHHNASSTQEQHESVNQQISHSQQDAVMAVRQRSSPPIDFSTRHSPISDGSEHPPSFAALMNPSLHQTLSLSPSTLVLPGGGGQATSILQEHHNQHSSQQPSPHQQQQQSAPAFTFTFPSVDHPQQLPSPDFVFGAPRVSNLIFPASAIYDPTQFNGADQPQHPDSTKRRWASDFVMSAFEQPQKRLRWRRNDEKMMD